MYNVQEIALNLLDFCGGQLPTESELQKFLQVREMELETGIRCRVLIEAEQLLTMP